MIFDVLEGSNAAQQRLQGTCRRCACSAATSNAIACQHHAWYGASCAGWKCFTHAYRTCVDHGNFRYIHGCHSQGMGRKALARNHVAAAGPIQQTHKQHNMANTPGLDPLQSAMQQTAQQLNARGIFDADVNELRSRLMHMAKQHRMLASRRPVQPTMQVGKRQKHASKARIKVALSDGVLTIEGWVGASCPG